MPGAVDRAGEGPRFHPGGRHLTDSEDSARRALTEKEAELAATQELNRRILEAMPGGVVHVRSDGSIAHANAEALRVLGLSYDQLTRLYTKDFDTETFHEDGTPCPVEHYPVTRALVTGETQPPHTIGIRRPDGKVSWAVFRAVPVQSQADGEVTGAVVAFMDITERKAIEQALQESEARYRELVESSPDPMATVSGATILFLNPAGARLVGVEDAASLIGRDVHEILPNGAFERLADYAARRRAGEQLAPLEERVRRADGELVDVDLSAVPFTFRGQPATLFVARDLRPRRQAEARLRALELQMQQAQKLESLGLLAGGVAHDFNNLLAAILGNASMIKIHLGPSSAASDSLAALEAAAQRAADLTRQMLAYSGRGKLRFEPVDLTSLVRDMAELLSTVVSKRAVVSSHFEPNLPAIEADPVQLQQVVMNLILNASDALEGQAGAIQLSTGCRSLTAEDLGQTYVDDGLPEGRYVFLEVTDTGRGMDDATRSRVFDPFFTTKATGRGLGLAATLGIVRSHRGAVSLESAAGRGTTFRVFFPPSARPSLVVPRSAPEVARAHADATVLVVDDEPAVRDVTSRLLTELGYRVVEAQGGRAALDEYRAHGARIDAVVLDMTMADMSGLEVVEELVRLDDQVRIVLCSGYSEEDVTQGLNSEHVVGFLEKPYTVTALVEALDRATRA